MLRRLLLLLIAATCPLTHAGDVPTNVLVLTGGVVGVSATESPARTAGYGRELISKLMQDAGLSYTMEPQPFARALRTLETQPNAVLFPMLRTAERESKYQWVGLMAKRNHYLYRLDSRKDIVIQSLEDARQYRIDLIVFSDEGIRLVCEEAKVACDAFTPAFRLDLVGNLWLAASPQMPPALLSTLRKAFQKQEDSGYLSKLMKSGRPVGG